MMGRAEGLRMDGTDVCSVLKEICEGTEVPFASLRILWEVEEGRVEEGDVGSLRVFLGVAEEEESEEESGTNWEMDDTPLGGPCEEP